jgi:AcrR family transcriptional regulator
VFAAALATFRRDGVDASRIEDIVARAGVSSGTFYFHFATKEDVLAELATVSGERVAAVVARVPRRASLSKVLETVCLAVAAEWQHDPALFGDVGVVAVRRAGIPSKDAVREALVPRFRAASESGELVQKIPAELLVEFFLLDLFATAMAVCREPKVQFAKVLPTVATLFLDGARARKRRL